MALSPHCCVMHITLIFSSQNYNDNIKIVTLNVCLMKLLMFD